MTCRELTELVAGLAGGTVAPRRVVYNAAGLAVSPQRALRDHGITPDLVFIRDDGWTLACPLSLVSAAWCQWSDKWVAVVPLPRHPMFRAWPN